MIEKWRQCVGIPEYHVSNIGRVKRVAGGKGAQPGHILRPAPDTRGYPMAHLWQENKRRPIAIHRLVAEAFIGPPPSPLHQVAHNDGSKDNNLWTNLRWATPKENNADKVKHGTHNRGSRHYRSKLTAENVKEARKRRQQGEYIKDLAVEFGVHKGTMSCAIRGVSWGWIK